MTGNTPHEQHPGGSASECSVPPGGFSTASSSAAKTPAATVDEAAIMPREKLAMFGRGSLSDEELLALFLRTGMQGCGVMELASLLKQRAGSLAALAALEPADITELCRGIGPAKAATLAAAFELGRRAAQEGYSALKFISADSVYTYMAQEVRHLSQEHIYLLALNARRELIRRVLIARGTLTRVLVHPRDVFREAIRANASSVILVHNHPSGNPTPSPQDNALTEQMVSAGDTVCIPIVDHVIIGAPSASGPAYYSFREHGIIS